MKHALPRYWKVVIYRITGLHFCDQRCGCGENNQLWWFPPGIEIGSMADWVPGWMNGADTYEIWRWLVKSGRSDYRR